MDVDLISARIYLDCLRQGDCGSIGTCDVKKIFLRSTDLSSINKKKGSKSLAHVSGKFLEQERWLRV
jgi:hypothetical protein